MHISDFFTFEKLTGRCYFATYSSNDPRGTKSR